MESGSATPPAASSASDLWNATACHAGAGTGSECARGGHNEPGSTLDHAQVPTRLDRRPARSDSNCGKGSMMHDLFNGTLPYVLGTGLSLLCAAIIFNLRIRFRRP